MKNILFCTAIVLILFSSCKKEEKLEVDMTKYNTSINFQSDLDKWLGTTFTDPYNIDVIYRFDRNLTDVAKDISPVEIKNVQPMMEAVLNGYLKPYEKVAGKKFIKNFCPKQYVLYGSVSYNTNGSVTLATAEGGRKVVLYSVNDFDVKDVTTDNGVRRKLRTIHHEFTHILNQNVIIPPEFDAISQADYFPDWTNDVENTASIAKNLAFVSRYARSSSTEDFAEMTAHLLVEGQVWFENYLVSAPISAQRKLRLKEGLVVQYFLDAFGIDFRVLQAEVQGVLKATYGAKDPEDLTQTFQGWLAANKVSTLTFQPTASHYTTFGISNTFNTVWNNFKNGVSGLPGTTSRFPQDMLFTFTSDSTMVLRVNYLNNAKTSTLSADYDFVMDVDPVLGEVKFIKSLPEGTTTQHGNGQHTSLKPFFEQHLLAYFTNRVFVAGWLPSGINATNPLFRTFAGFTEKGVSTNFFYGPIALK